jgi:hypothetical protein
MRLCGMHGLPTAAVLAAGNGLFFKMPVEKLSIHYNCPFTSSQII